LINSSLLIVWHPRWSRRKVVRPRRRGRTESRKVCSVKDVDVVLRIDQFEHIKNAIYIQLQIHPIVFHRVSQWVGRILDQPQITDAYDASCRVGILTRL
jgi:hypothetical protein